jgi:hypothetical protein
VSRPQECFRLKYSEFVFENAGEMRDSKSGNCGLFEECSKLAFLLKKSAITCFSAGFSGGYFPIRICQVFFVGNDGSTPSLEAFLDTGGAVVRRTELQTSSH